jgi:hypothetical protein
MREEEEGGFVKKSCADAEVLGLHKHGRVKDMANMVDALRRTCQL